MKDLNHPPESILVVDDQLENLVTLSEILRAEGYEVNSVINGPTALEAVHAFLPDLILLDILMPDMDGYDVCETLKVDPVTRDIPVIFISALDDSADKVKGFSAGGIDYITKPFEREDVSARVKIHLKIRHLEKSLRASEAIYRGVFENTNNGVVIYETINDGSDFLIKDINRSVERIEKIRKEDVVNKRVTEVFKGVESFGILDVFQQVWKTGKTIHHPTAFYRDNRIEGWRDNFVFKLPAGEVVAVYSDETESKQALENLQLSEEKFRNLFAAIPDPIFIHDCHTNRILNANNTAAKQYGYPLAELTQLYAHDFSTPEHAAQTKDHLEKLQCGKTMVFETVHQNAKGIIFPVEVHCRRTELRGQNVFLTVCRNITERKSAEKNRQQLEEKLRQAQKMESIGTLAGGIAHDFNNILASALGYTELALDVMEKGSPLESYLQEIFTACNRAKDLVQQILTFSRQSNQDLKPVRVSLIAKEALKLLRSSLPADIHIRTDIDSRSLVLADPTQIHQIFMNLCTNAAQAMEETGGELNVTLKDVQITADSGKPAASLAPGEYLELTISDTGPGILPDAMSSIFDPYFTTKEPGEGTGMGLAIVHGIVKSCRGEIAVESTPRQGVIFTIHIPTHERITDSKAYQPEVLPTGSERILFIDDEQPITKMTGQILQRLGYTVTTRTSSIEALELFRAKPKAFDLVLTDMTMPNMTGDRLAREMMAIRPDIPVILCTGYSKRLSEEQAIEFGIKAIAHKPLIKSELAATVRRVLDQEARK